MIDVLYPIGPTSKYNDLELKLSLRTLQQNGKNIRRVFIIGEYLPDWINKDKIEFIKSYNTDTPEKNIFSTFVTATYSGISKEFLVMNDDHFMMQPFDAEIYPHFKSNLYVHDSGYYSQMISNTQEWLENKGLQTDVYMIHAPFRVRSVCIREMSKLYEQGGILGFHNYTLYGNLFHVNATSINDTKIRNNVIVPPNRTGCISTGDENCEAVLNRVQQLFPNKSKYEL